MPANPIPAALVDALDIAGGIEALARQLHVPRKQLTSWIEGDEATPHSVFERALAFVHGGSSR